MLNLNRVVGMLLAVSCLALTSGCTVTRDLNLHYTPLIQTERLANRSSPQVIEVGEFVDGRTQTMLAQFRAVGGLLTQYESKDDVVTFVRSSFVDALLKSGFEVPLPNQQDSKPLFKVTGKITNFQANIDIGWDIITATHEVAVEVTITPIGGNPTSISMQGKNIQQGERIQGNNLEAGLDSALQDCIKKFLENEKFRGLVKR